jgi:serine/threonine protein kinase
MDNTMDVKESLEQKNVQEQSLKTDIPQQPIRYKGFLCCIQVNKKRWQALVKEIEKLIQQYGCSYEYALMILSAQKKIDDEEFSYFKRISPQELILHCHYILKYLRNYLTELQAKGGLHFYAHHTKLPRSFMLALNEKTGRISLFIEGNSKMADMHCGKKRIDMSPEMKTANTKLGAFKQGKFSLEISSVPAKRYVRLKALSKNIDLTEHPFEKEAERAKRFGEYAAPLEYCFFYYSKKDSLNAVAFSESAYCSLSALIHDTSLMHNNMPVTMRLRLKLIKDILLCVLKVHTENYVHQDLKPSNILIYKILDPVTLAQRFSAKLCDFGNAVLLESEGAKLGSSFNYAAPEMFIGSSDPKYSRHDYYHKNKFDCFSYGKKCYLALDQSQYLAIEHQAVDKPHDMWALGLIIYEILWGNLNILDTDVEKIQLFEQRVKADPFLASCLAVDPKQRISIEAAVLYIEDRIEAMQSKPCMCKQPFTKP